MEFYAESISQTHVDNVGTLINLGNIDFDRQDVRRAKNFERDQQKALTRHTKDMMN